ncbi:acyl-CoA thioesterase [Virgibacillus sp. MSJ-26]|uniref:acyl-CoA thioesterase n=1 Tax=Virgibacillus sp. MSJ-26 TaxID=2841522 RepID=UPI001C108CD6|nr:thioesterase family protein [Virgibacillus sp. MSJ-26]MBU5466550.1 acyl-CoA thioesterase [Virgibacillus sp. MSJ-26]
MSKIPYINNIEEWRSDFKFSIPINIRFSETDMFGHVNNVSPFIYFEEGRIEFMKSVGLFGNLSNDQNDVIPIVADLQCDYHKQMYFNDEINLFIKVNEIGNSSFDMHYMALDKNKEICLTGRGRIVSISPANGKPVPLSDKMKQKILEA